MSELLIVYELSMITLLPPILLKVQHSQNIRVSVLTIMYASD